MDTGDDPLLGSVTGLQGSGSAAVLSGVTGQPSKSSLCVSPVLSPVQCDVSGRSLVCELQSQSLGGFSFRGSSAGGTGGGSHRGWHE